MAVITGTPPDSDTEVIVSVDESAASAADDKPSAMDGETENTPTPADDGADTAEPEVKPSADVKDDEPAKPATVEENELEPEPEPEQVDGSGVQKLYRHDCHYECCPSRWSKFATHQDEQNALEAEVRAVPIVQRHAFNSDKEWVTVSFNVHCPHMRAFLAEALARYQDLDLDLEGWTFSPPYKPLVHRWDRILALHRQIRSQSEEGDDDNDNDNDTEEGKNKKKAAVDQLVDFLQPILAGSIEDLTSTRDTGTIRYDMLWQIYPPGEQVLTKFYGVDTICRVVKYHKSQRRRCWIITLEYVDWDGERCGLRTTEVRIPLYSGLRRVTSFPAYPLSFAEKPEEIREAMMARGRRFQELRGYHFLSYEGVKILTESNLQQPMSGRVVIDTYAYYKSNNLVKPEMGSLGCTTSTTTTTTNETAAAGDDGDAASEYGDGDDNANANDMSAVANNPAASERVEDLTELSDEHCLLTTPWLIGFDLKAKTWGRFLIDKLGEVVWNDKAYDNLVLPGGEKELAWDFVQSKSRSNEVIDDFVPDKGRGLIILMFGPPGVGKTYTAEAVAEKARVPLYLVSAGMLGTSPEVVEPALDHALELCRMWNAMLLLDEADVFLGARLDDSLTRNELVSIFLTKLEYYQGILFLTTNRFSRIDHAFQSRVDLFLPYHDLDAATRTQVWHNFLEHFGGADKFDVTPRDVADRFAALPLNGREIKNLLKSAQLLTARREGGKVKAETLALLAEKRVAALRMLEERHVSVGR
ncbi:P-loop containing nucleoside triphosphate hydrolase protein [Chaetomium strumarium]|uniref:P-loop containing nucleoside triphosphate hydrolase protein n=1 Tax=Chaetomium strumarium TaxID=1170767 RepID=A0AAJ0LYW8_9PEZI|nr:P-loop containing nucleoside triphosphate hydrolase protein [Chaetomium strumarium]